MCHPHMLTQDPERLLEGELEDEVAGPEGDRGPADEPAREPKKVQVPA